MNETFKDNEIQYSPEQVSAYVEASAKCKEIHVMKSRDGRTVAQAYVGEYVRHQLEIRGIGSTTVGTHEIAALQGANSFFSAQKYCFKVNMSDLAKACGGAAKVQEILEKSIVIGNLAL